MISFMQNTIQKEEFKQLTEEDSENMKESVFSVAKIPILDMQKSYRYLKISQRIKQGLKREI